MFLALAFCFTCVGVTCLDSGFDLKKAYEFTQDQIDWGIRPGYIFLLGIAFKAFGPSVWAATVVVRVFFVANVFLIFFMVRYLADKRAAFAASLMLVTSYFLSYLSHRILVDNIHPFFVLLAVFLSILAIDRESNKLAFAAGLAFVYAYLVKSTTLLFFPFPVALALLRHGSRPTFSTVKQAGIVCTTFGLGIFFYQIFLHFVNVSISVGFDETGTLEGLQVLSKHSQSALSILSAETPWRILTNSMRGFLKFWERFLFQDAILGWLFASAWIWILARSVKVRNYRAILLIGIFFLPAMIYLGHTNLRQGQAAVFLIAGFIPVGVLIADAGSGLASLATFHGRYSRLRAPAGAFAVTALAGFLSFYQIHLAKDRSYPFLEHTHLVRLLKGAEPHWELRGAFNASRQKAGEIITANAPSGAVVFTGFSNVWALDFFTDYRYHVYPYPTGFFAGRSLQAHFADDLKGVVTGNPVLPGPGSAGGVGTVIPKGPITGKLIFLWPNAWVSTLDHWNATGELRIRYIDEGILNALLSADKPFFVALDWRYKHIGAYLERISGAVKLSANPLIYKVNAFSLVEDFDRPKVACEMAMLLDQLRTVHSENYRILRDDFFPVFFGLSPRQVDALADRNEEAAGVDLMPCPRVAAP